MKEEIQKLISLQVIDSEIAGFDREISRNLAKIAEQEKNIADKQKTITTYRAKIETLSQKHGETVTEHEDAGIRVKDRQNKMMQVQTSREHQALLKEIEENKRLFKETEERILLFLEQIEQLEKEVTALDNLCAGEIQLLAEVNETVEKEIKRIEVTKKSVTLQREKEAGELHASHLKRYAMLLNRRDGLAVVAINDSVCQGCFMTLPPQQVNEVRKGDKMNLCPTCQRILYFKVEEEEDVAK